MASDPINNITFHAGFSKTGTTYLQHQFFSQHKGITYLGRPFDNQHVLQLFLQVCYCDSILYDSEKVDYALNALCEQLQHNGNPVVISDEALTSTGSVDRILKAQRLKKIFGEAKFIFTIRNQIRMIESLYFELHKISLKNNTKPPEFDSWIKEDISSRKMISKAMMADFEPVINQFTDLFGADKILIIPVERLWSDPIDHLTNISNFIGTHQSLAPAVDQMRVENPRISKNELRYRLFRSHFFPGINFGSTFGFISASKLLMKKLQSGKPAHVTWPKQELDELQNYFGKGNRKLDSKYNLRLAELGYPI